MSSICKVKGFPAGGVGVCRKVKVGMEFCGSDATCEHKQAVHQTIALEDHGQDFLEWDLDADGNIIACRPAQGWLWTQRRVINHSQLVSGGSCVVQSPDGTQRILNYPVWAIRKEGA